MNEHENGHELMKEWARAALADELVWTREASTAGRRAYHEGMAAAFAVTAGDLPKSSGMLTTILADYTGVRATEGRRGYAHGVAMTRGVALYLEYRGGEAAAWTGEAASDA